MNSLHWIFNTYFRNSLICNSKSCSKASIHWFNNISNLQLNLIFHLFHLSSRFSYKMRTFLKYLLAVTLDKEYTILFCLSWIYHSHVFNHTVFTNISEWLVLHRFLKNCPIISWIFLESSFLVDDILMSWLFGVS